MNGKAHSAGMAAQAESCKVGRESKSVELFSTLHLVIEVRDRLEKLKKNIGSEQRPCDAKEMPCKDIDPSSLVNVVSTLRGEVQMICCQALVMIDELQEDLL